MPYVSCASKKGGISSAFILWVTLVLICSNVCYSCAFLDPYRPKGNNNKIHLFQPWISASCYASSRQTTTSIASSQDEGDDIATISRYPSDLVDSLDLLPLLEAVSRHAGTRRGRQAFLALAGADYAEILPKSKNHNGQERQGDMSSKNRRAFGVIKPYTQQQEQALRNVKTQQFAISIAESITEARHEYSLVAEAQFILKKADNSSYPPLYGSASSPWDTEHVAETDYDSFLRHAETSEESTLEHIIHAEKIIETIRKVRLWGNSDIVKEFAPSVAEIASSLDYEILESLYQEISGTVAIKRVRTLTDPSGRSSFRFELNADKFHVVQVLRTQVEEMEEKINKQDTGKSSCQKLEAELADLVEKLEATEDDIQSALLQSILGKSNEINKSLDRLALLDVIFAKAAFGESVGGIIPIIENEGKIEVHQFVHPVLLLSEGTENNHRAVAIDLRLSSEDKRRALIISGPNGGGKTAAMKSFGLAAILCQLGIPIPCRQSHQSDAHHQRVDFFRNIHVALGDRQSLIDGESTMMARLNACASVIKNISLNRETEAASLVLIDEIGGGTDPDAGGAIAQAILEKLLETKSCRIVATTHVPRLKVLSYESEKFGCATVLLEANSDDIASGGYQRPSFELFYDSIGDSAALAAASRCVPALPEDVLSRASQLMVESAAGSPNNLESDTPSASSTDGAYLRVLTESIERQSERSQQARLSAERNEQDIAACRRAMLSLALAYDRDFQFLQQKLENTYAKLNESDADTLEVVGGTLSELRLVRKEVKSQSQLLKEKGLKLLPDWYDLSVGENVVIVSESDIDGVSATIHPDMGSLSLKSDDVAVVPSLLEYDDFMGADFSSEGIESSADKKPLILKRSQIAIWDYASMWDEDDGGGIEAGLQATSIKDSKRRLNDILLNIKGSSSSSPKRSANSPDSSSSSQKVFTSARQRKATLKKNNAKSTKSKRKRG